MFVAVTHRQCQPASPELYPAWNSFPPAAGGTVCLHPEPCCQSEPCSPHPRFPLPGRTCAHAASPIVGGWEDADSRIWVSAGHGDKKIDPHPPKFILLKIISFVDLDLHALFCQRCMVSQGWGGCWFYNWWGRWGRWEEPRKQGLLSTY